MKKINSLLMGIINIITLKIRHGNPSYYVIFIVKLDWVYVIWCPMYTDWPYKTSVLDKLAYKEPW